MSSHQRHIGDARVNKHNFTAFHTHFFHVFVTYQILDPLRRRRRSRHDAKKTMAKVHRSVGQSMGCLRLDERIRRLTTSRGLSLQRGVCVCGVACVFLASSAAFPDHAKQASDETHICTPKKGIKLLMAPNATPKTWVPHVLVFGLQELQVVIFYKTQLTQT
eukprot:2069541-Amphidinium_carterae.1